MNIYDISNKTGFSIATISRVINNKGNVSKKTKEKILSAIQESGYTPNVFARGLGLNSIKTVGVMCSVASDMYLATAVTIVERELRQYGYDCILCNTGYDFANKEKYLNLLLRKRVDAIVLIGSQFKENGNNDHIASAASIVPVMLINFHLDMKNVYSTLCADYEATYQATRSLISAGHTKILFCYDSVTYSCLEKINGYKAAVSDAGLTLSQDLIVHFPRDVKNSREIACALLDKGLDFTSALCTEDVIAVGVIKAALDKGFKIPEEFNIIGFNDSLLAQSTTPELSSIDNKIEALCKNAIMTLIGVFAGEKVPHKTVISAELIERGSTCFDGDKHKK